MYQEVRYKPPALKSLETLSDNHRAWLEHYFDDSLDVKVTAKAFGVSPQAVRYVVDSPAGQGYAIKRIGASKSDLNLLAAKLILDKMHLQGMNVPLEILVKIYSASLPKESPQGRVDDLVDYAERIANQLGFKEEEREQLLDFVRQGAA
jgi:hypothetical protein